MSRGADGRCRLPTGGRINRAKPLRFRFNGREYSGFEGDSLASALLANGISIVARSFKYHRPRGIFTAGEEEPCALVETGSGAHRVPNVRATLVPLQEGLEANSQRGWPSLNFDVGRLFDLSYPLWPAGFYNKTFKWPSWQAWEGLVRHAAGLGRAPDLPDPARYEQVNAHCDLLVCGGGPTGLVAARTAAAAGLRVLLAEQQPECGGVLNHEITRLDGAPGWDWAHRLTAELRAHPRVILLENTTVTGIYDHNVTTLLQTGQGTAWRECLWTLRPRRILLATGAIEQGLIFPGNDRPGILLASAVRHYLHRHAVLPGRRIVVATNNDSAWQTAFDLAESGCPALALVDSRNHVDPGLRERLAATGTTLYTGARIGGTHGFGRLRRLQIEGAGGVDLGTRRCDLLAVSGGWSPRVHLLAHARGELTFDPGSQSFIPGRLPSAVAAVGSVMGPCSLQRALEQAVTTAARIASELGCSPTSPEAPRVSQAPIEAGSVAAIPPVRERRRQWIDLAHDVTFGDAELAVREGFSNVEHFKRYTTTGMSLDQGKTGNLNAFVALGALTGRSPGEVGTTTFRPPYVPVTLGALAGPRRGELYAPRRLLPAHRVHVELGAHMEDYGWQRPDYYPRNAESPQQAICREVLAVRQAVGVFDNSPIGKLEVCGPDAARFLDRFYINNVTSLAPGRARYGLMLNENGVIIDDGVFLRLAEDRFLLNTTSGGVGRIRAMLEEWQQCEWPDSQLGIFDLTESLANFTVAGPRARELLANMAIDIDLAAAALPHMTFAEGRMAGLPLRVVRVSFSGETSFEVNLPASYASAFLRALLAAGAPLGLQPYGVEALMVLRAEKGYMHVGSDTDGSTTPDDVGWGHVAAAKHGDYLGKRSLSRSANRDPQRRQFVGLEALDRDRSLRPGGHLLIGADRRPPAPSDGWITSACYSPTLRRHIALGMLRAGREHLGEIVTVCDEDERFEVKVVSPVFYDPSNARLQE